MKKRNPFPGVTRMVDRHGKVRWRFRAKSGFTTYLPGPYNSAEFRAAYEAAVQGSKVRPNRSTAAHGTFAWLIEEYIRSAKYADLSDGRRRSLRSLLDWIRGKVGDLPFNRMTPLHVERLMAKKDGPVAANNVKKTLSILFNYAVKHSLAGQKVNPASHADTRKTGGDGFYTWTRADVAKFLDHHGPGTKARLAMLIFYYTGAARGDASRLGWQNVKNGRIAFKRGKTGGEVDMPIAQPLAEDLDRLPKDQMLFLTHGRGLPYRPETLGMWFKDRCIEAGLPQCTSHGLRKAAATILAEGAGTEHEVMAFLGHKTPKEGATYTKKASRARLTDSAMAKIAGTKTEQNLSNLPVRLDRKES